MSDQDFVGRDRGGMSGLSETPSLLCVCVISGVELLVMGEGKPGAMVPTGRRGHTILEVQSEGDRVDHRSSLSRLVCGEWWSVPWWTQRVQKGISNGIECFWCEEHPIKVVGLFYFVT